MTKKAIFTLVLACFALAPNSYGQSVPEMLADISRLKNSEWFAAKSRFEFLLPRMDRIRTDLPSQTRVADVIVKVRGMLKEEGVSRLESIPQLTENMYVIALHTDEIYKRKGIDPPNKCLEPWAFYMQACEKGRNEDQSIAYAKLLVK